MQTRAARSATAGRFLFGAALDQRPTRCSPPSSPASSTYRPELEHGKPGPIARRSAATRPGLALVRRGGVRAGRMGAGSTAESSSGVAAIPERRRKRETAGSAVSDAERDGQQRGRRRTAAPTAPPCQDDEAQQARTPPVPIQRVRPEQARRLAPADRDAPMRFCAGHTAGRPASARSTPTAADHVIGAASSRANRISISGTEQRTVPPPPYRARRSWRQQHLRDSPAVSAHTER